ncbi:hypothetical protein [Azohydromonas aeria]|uniref:hypothetical protein n=1 Tax=Azohydromonas aeria TaxID=2590212 RepID=UPI0012F975D1|nr:hypothetical protein [Azohydromonas aeria]
MAITPLPTAPSRDRPATFRPEADAFLGAFPGLVTEINTTGGNMMSLEASTYSAMLAAQQAAASAAASVNSPSYTGTSVSSLALTAGAKTVAVPAGKNWAGGMTLQLWNSPTSFMSGVVTSYSGTTLTITINNVTGTGTFASWQISVLPSVAGLTDDLVIAALGYTPPRANGTGATGVWPISVSGNAATVTTLTAAQIIAALNFTPVSSTGANASGNWNISVQGSAGSVAWSNVAGRPSNLSDFANGPGYITTNGRAYPRRSDGAAVNIVYSGQSGQPNYLLGTNDGVTFAVWDPDIVAVRRAATAGVADSANAVDWSQVANRPTRVSQFTNDSGFVTTATANATYFNAVAIVNVYQAPSVPLYHELSDVSFTDNGGTLTVTKNWKYVPPVFEGT